jgi:parvulin-like peptidyl-prolyl isomerase
MARSRGPISPTKKHLARVERERLMRRYLFAGTILVFAAVVGIIAYGLIQQYVFIPRQTVARVNNVEITARDFIARTRYERFQLIQRWINTYQTMQIFAGQSPELELQFRNQMQQIQFQLEPSSIGRDTINRMIEEVLIQQEAEQRGITVSEQEIDEFIQAEFGFFPDGVAPTATIFPTALPTSTLSPLQETLTAPTATPEVTPTETPAEEPEAEETASPTPEAEAEPTEATETEGEGDDEGEAPELPSPTPTFEPTLTPTPYTLEAFQQEYRDVINSYQDAIGFTERQLREVIRTQLLQNKLVEVIAQSVPMTQEQVWARHILVEDEGTARQVLEQLNDGADFATLAAEFSQDPGSAMQGGDLGWFSVGVMFQEFETVAFNLNVGQYSQPVQSPAGWHIIQSLGKENRSLSEPQYQQARQTAFQTWLTNARQSANPELLDVWSQVVPSEPVIPATLLAQSSQ